MSDMGGLPSKYHDDSGVPFPGPDAFALAVGTLERDEPEQQARERRAEKRARESIASPIDPTRVEFVTHGDGRLCIDCHWCRDWDQRRPPALLSCTRGIITAANGGYPPDCVTARSDHFNHLSCGRDALWFEDAIERDSETAWSQTAAGGRLSAP